MRQLVLALALIGALFSCNKETTTPNTTSKNTSDTIKIENDTIKISNDVSISGFDCAGVKIEGTLTKDKIASNVTVILTYTGGNGKTYLTKSHTSSGVNGLSANLFAGTLANGEGTLVYSISGTPDSTGIANFVIDFGGKSCEIVIKVQDVVQTLVKTGPNIKDSEGNFYKTVYIGTQQWMAQNLKASKYNDGSTIPNITDYTQWQKDTTGAWSCYSNANYVYYNSTYGKLYNWYALSPSTNGNKNVCPTGWHVPSDAEWTILTDYLGGLGGSGASGKLKEAGTTHWNSPNLYANNTSLFTALPGGYRFTYGNYYGISEYGYWWSSSEDITNRAFSRHLCYDNFGTYRNALNKHYGLSVRCIKD